MIDAGFVQEGEAWGDVPQGLPLVVAMAGVRDPGAVVAQLVQAADADHRADEEPEAVVATFDPDILFDYRARRPVVEVDEGRMIGLDGPELVLSKRTDDLGQEYLLLAGFEPDFRWNAFTEAIAGILATFRVPSTTWVQSIAMPVPHTRPIRLSAVGNRPELVEQLSVWSPHTQAPALAVHQLAYRLAELGHPVLGLLPLVPHYVAELAVPGGVLAAAEGIAATTGIMIATEGLRDADREFRRTVDEQIAGNEEVLRLIGTLEAQHDAYLEEQTDLGVFAGADGTLPTAEDIAGELERFLAAHRDDES